MTDLVDEEKSLAKRNGLLLLKALRQNLGLHHTPPQESKPHKSSCYALFRKIKRHNSSSYARTRQTKAHHTRQQQLEHVICITPTNRQIKPHNSTTAAGIIYKKKRTVITMQYAEKHAGTGGGDESKGKGKGNQYVRRRTSSNGCIIHNHSIRHALLAFGTGWLPLAYWRAYEDTTTTLILTLPLRRAVTAATVGGRRWCRQKTAIQRKCIIA